MEVENSDLVNLETAFNRAQYLENENPSEAIKLYTQVLNSPLSLDEVDALKEDSTLALSKLYSKNGDPSSIEELLKSARTFFEKISKAKSAKIVRTLVDDVLSIDGSEDIKMSILKENIQWAMDGKRTFLAHRLQLYFADALYHSKQYTESMNLLVYLIRALTQIDDKAMLIECYLIQANIYHDLMDYTKAKSCLNQARMLLSTVYVEPHTQNNIDLLSGIIASYQGDYINGFAYLQEAYDGNRIVRTKMNVDRLVGYMLLIKILSGKENEVNSFLQNKIVIDHYSQTISFLKDVFTSMKNKDLNAIDQLFMNNPTILEDPVMKYHMNNIKNQIFEQLLLKVVEPFSVVYIDYIANIMKQSKEEIEAKLSQMILDKKLYGVIDQETQTFIHRSSERENKLAESVNASVNELESTITVLSNRINNYSKKLQSM